MEYLISFLEGVITFISPCFLPMIPVYVMYFAAGKEQQSTVILKNALAFSLGFTLVFVLMGALAGIVGSFLLQHRTIVNVICGAVVVFFGLSFLGVIKLSVFKGLKDGPSGGALNFFSSFLFGIVFSISWTPCVGAFLGSALMLASQQGSMLVGMGMLLAYSCGLSIPFILSALLIDKLKHAFDAIKQHYATITKVCGAFLIFIGVLMATGLIGDFLSLLS